MDDLSRAKNFVQGKDAVSTHALREEMNIDPLRARMLMSELERQGVISDKWDFFKGGYPVLQKGVER